MRLIDMHCDTVLGWMHNENMNLKDCSLCVDLNKMKQADSLAQFFACFIYMKRFQGEDRFAKGYEHALKLIARAKQEFAKYPEEILLATNVEEMLRNDRAGKMSAILTVEEGGVIDGKMENLEELYRQGIRLITLTWNEENCLGFPNSKDKNIMNQGLKKFGIEAVERMNDLGIIVDVSHLSDGGFWDVLKYSKKPVIASHSNARALCGHQRNLTDEMIRALAEKGGVSGINFYPCFLTENGKAGIDDLVRHIEHMYYVGGEDFVAMGTDFDGFDDGELELKHLGEIPYLYEALKKRKFNDGQIEKFWNGNAMRVMKESMK